MALSQGRRQRAAETRAAPTTPPLAAPRSQSPPCAPYPVIWVQAFTHCTKGTQSDLPLSHWASGVFQNSMVLKYASGAFAWYAAHDPWEILFISGQASELAGVSP